VPHNNTSAGRSCWYGRNSLFSAEIPPMSLARDTPPDWQISQRVSASSLHHQPSPVGERCGSYKPRHTPKSSWLAITPSRSANHGSNGIEVLHSTENEYCTIHHEHRTPSMSAGQELFEHCLGTTSSHYHTSVCSTNNYSSSLDTSVCMRRGPNTRAPEAEEM
jgi:hypothetical protein